MNNHLSYLLKFLFIISITNSCHTMFLLTAYITTKHPQVQPFASLIKEDQRLLCHDYAFLTAMDARGQFPFIHGTDWYEKYDILNTCFKKTTSPQPGYIVTYQNKQHEKILHVGCVHDDIRYVISKWGPCMPHVFLHKTGDVPPIYGNYITYYQPTKTPKEMRNYIRNCKQNSPEMSISEKNKCVTTTSNQYRKELKLCILTVMIISLWMYNNS